MYMLVISVNKEIVKELRDLDQVLYFFNLLLFKKNIVNVEIIALIDFESKVNTINLDYAATSGLKV